MTCNQNQCSMADEDSEPRWWRLVLVVVCDDLSLSPCFIVRLRALAVTTLPSVPCFCGVIGGLGGSRQRALPDLIGLDDLVGCDG